MEQQWIALKEIYHRDFVVAAAKVAAAAAAKATAEQKGNIKKMEWTWFSTSLPHSRFFFFSLTMVE